MFTIGTFLFISVINNYLILAEIPPKVSTSLGIIEGTIQTTYSGRRFFQFEGIPYAAPPVDELRYENPRDPQKWNEILNATALISCFQYSQFGKQTDGNYIIIGDEDCLYFNVYTPTLNKSANLEVMIHIHGGAYMFGSGGGWRPQIILNRPIVYVTFNYRLGPLGFLSTEDDILPGNLGLRDQQQALKVIKMNINHFGGSPNSITLHGLSAGSASVQFHCLLPGSKGVKTKSVSSLVTEMTDVRMQTKQNVLYKKPSWRNSGFNRTALPSIPPTKPLLQEQFGDYDISKNGPVNYAAKNCDLKPCDFFLWIYVKSNVYANNTRTVEDLTTNIRNVIIEIPAQRCANVTTNWTEMRYCQQRAIAESGTVLNNWVLMESPLEKAKHLASLVGCPTNNSAKLKICMKKKPALEILGNINHFQPFLYNPFSPWAVVIDGYWSSNPVLPDHPLNLLRKKKIHDVPLLMSFVTSEGLYPAAEFYGKNEYLEEINTNWNKLMPHIMMYNYTVNHRVIDWVSQRIRMKYLGKAALDKTTFSGLVQAIGDRCFVADIEKGLRLHSAGISSPVWSYMYNYRANTSVSEYFSGSNKNIGISHGDDTILILGFSAPVTPDDVAMSELLIDMTMSFILTGRPNISNKWQPISKNLRAPLNMLRINKYDDLQTIKKKHVGKRPFWDSLPFNENEKLLNFVPNF